MKSNLSIGAWPLIFIFLAIVSVSALFITYLKSTNKIVLENFINQRVEEERTKILSEFNKQEDKNLEAEILIDINQKISEIIPKGSFKSLDSFSKKLLANLADELEITQAIFYNASSDFSTFSYLTGFALTNDKSIADFKTGENLNGQVATSQEIMVVNDIPDDYLSIESGLGKSKPRNLILVPFVHKEKTIAVLEFTTFQELTNDKLKFLAELAGHASEKMYNLKMS